MITWFASFPRSGNTFARIMFYKYFGIKTYSVYNSSLSAAEIGSLPMADLVGEGCWKKENIQSFAADSAPRLVKTHDMPGDDVYPAIYLVRDGRDALVSYAHFMFDYERKDGAVKTREAFFQTLRDLIDQNASFGGWGSNVAAWLARKAKTCVIKYEDMLRDPAGVTRDALEATGYPMTDPVHGVIPSFEELKSRHAAFFRKGQTGSWRDEMPEELHELFWEKHGAVMNRLGYQR